MLLKKLNNYKVISNYLILSANLYFYSLFFYIFSNYIRSVRYLYAKVIKIIKLTERYFISKIKNTISPKFNIKTNHIITIIIISYSAYKYIMFFFLCFIDF